MVLQQWDTLRASVKQHSDIELFWKAGVGKERLSAGVAAAEKKVWLRRAVCAIDAAANDSARPDNVLRVRLS